MRMRRALTSMSITMCLSLASCSIAPQAVIRNATSADILLWPLGALPAPLRSGETTKPIIYSAHERLQALIKRENCLYAYPAPDYFQLPKHAKGYASRVVVVIYEDMTFARSRALQEGRGGPRDPSRRLPTRTNNLLRRSEQMTAWGTGFTSALGGKWT